jgi:Uncharacterized protein conserved in bacteria (DUF2188)
MPKKGDVQVVPGQGDCRVEVEGASRASSTHKTQQQAFEAGRKLARRGKAKLLVHSRNGRIRDRRTFGMIRAEPRARRFAT